jgi:hypothetical protein
VTAQDPGRELVIIGPWAVLSVSAAFFLYQDVRRYAPDFAPPGAVGAASPSATSTHINATSPGYSGGFGSSSVGGASPERDGMGPIGNWDASGALGSGGGGGGGGGDDPSDVGAYAWCTLQVGQPPAPARGVGTRWRGTWRVTAADYNEDDVDVLPD